MESSIKIIYSRFIVFAALWAETNACINQTSGISCFVHLYLQFTYGKIQKAEGLNLRNVYCSAVIRDPFETLRGGVLSPVDYMADDTAASALGSDTPPRWRFCHG